MAKLSLAAKANPPAFSALVLASLVNTEEATSPIEVDIVDEAAIDGEPVQIEGVLKTVYKGSLAVVDALTEGFDYIKPRSDLVEKALGPLSGKDFKSTIPVLEQLEAELNFDSFLSRKSSPDASDAVVWGSLRANGVVGAACKSGVYVNIARWYKFLDENAQFGGAIKTYLEAVADVRKLSKAGSKKESKASYDIGLVDAVEGKVVTRFPPEPSGYLHIGHAKAAVLNQYFADMYKGKLIIRFDDTNPSKEKVEFTESILEDLRLLGIKGDVITHSSDYFQEMYDLIVKMIKDGNAYADDTTQEVMRDQRMNGVASARRERTVEESLRVLEEMKKGSEEGLANCIRAKISVDAGNKTLRDPVMYRCNLTPHHRTGTQWKIYPTYDFCCPVVDAIEGVTHALRTIEYRDRNAQYEWVLKALGLRKVHVWDFSRVNFVRTLLSKRKLQWFVDNGKVSGWDDPRFPTVRGVRRRGMSVEGLRNFIVSQGPSKNILNLDWSLIWAVNKKVIDPISPRHTAIVEPVLIKLANGPKEIGNEKRPKHKKNAELGDKILQTGSEVIIDQEDAQTLAEGEEFTLMDWGNCIINAIHKDGDKVTGINATLNLEGDYRKTEKKLTWLAKTPELVQVDLVNFDHLITKDKIEEGESFEDFLTENTVFVTDAVADCNVRDLKEGDVIQFERKGYYRCDVPFDGKKIVFFSVPDGKVVNKYGAKKN